MFNLQRIIPGNCLVPAMCRSQTPTLRIYDNITVPSPNSIIFYDQVEQYGCQINAGQYPKHLYGTNSFLLSSKIDSSYSKNKGHFSVYDISA